MASHNTQLVQWSKADHAAPFHSVVNILLFEIAVLAISTFIVMIMIVECSLYRCVRSECTHITYTYIGLRLNSMAPIKDPKSTKHKRQTEREKSNSFRLQTRRK